METIRISKKQLTVLLSDAEKSAAAVNLTYVSDREPGIRRKRAGKGFSYVFKGKKVTDAEVLERIRKLVIPPAWKDVWICSNSKGHLQATGTDVRGRKQYRYHPMWSLLRNHTKFFQLLAFGRALPRIREQLARDLREPELTQRKVLASVVGILEQTSIRVGGKEYEKLYGSYGLTTLKNHHVQVEGSSVRFRFRGKKGIYHNVTLQSRKLAHIVRQCRELPGKELFEYIGTDGNIHAIDSGMVNEYIRELSDGPFTAKDFRTWAGTLQCLESLYAQTPGETESETKKQILAAIDTVALQLGNTRAVCRKYYIHPLVPEYFGSGRLQKVRAAAGAAPGGYTDMELILLALLEQENKGLVVE